MNEDLVDHAGTLLSELVALRRALHADAEVGMHLPATQRRVLATLEPLGLEVRLGRGASSIVAVLRGAHEGPTVLLRGDMDALPIREESGVDFAATNGAMHACGHDLHTAGLVGAARLLAARRQELHGSVVFMFQPGEELAGGAALMIGEGVLEATGERPVAAYGVHVVPGDRGVFSTRGGPVMAGALVLRVTFRGAGGHASEPHLAHNPVAALAAVTTALPSFVTTRFPVGDPVVLTVTTVQAGGPALNVIADEAQLGGTIRVLSRQSQDRVQAELPELIRSVAAVHGCRADVAVDVACPPTINDDRAASDALEVLRAVFGAERVRVTPEPVMASEDFAHVLAQVPGAFFFLRATPESVEPLPNHNAAVQFDDSLLADQAAALAALALRHLVPSPDRGAVAR